MTKSLPCMPNALGLPLLRRVVLVLLTALVLLQTLGVMHRVAHAQQSTGASMHVAADTSGVLAVIWGDHRNSAECQLFDQSCPDMWHMPTMALVLPPHVALWLTAVLDERLAPFERFYATRGPPVLY